MTRPSANDTDSVAPFQKVGAVAANVLGSNGLVHEMLRYPDELRRAYALLVEREGQPALTTRQTDLLRFLQGHIDRTGETPTYRQMAEGIGSNVSSIDRLVRGLEERGVITRKPKLRQSIVIVARAS